ncbi:riboflavin kinase [Arthrobacter sp. Cr_A7]|uniref:riboflavin kinase n=1 Tax=Arthrobacter sp. Cr_A7 TaxID=3031017 RepID=UPI0023D9C9BE|nr:riboflavin kinase [Arthrobacter sp. Cr_A7]MDF2050422.1 riboflavin kinase [Arthrobacter sp. Cr_A7]
MARVRGTAGAPTTVWWRAAGIVEPGDALGRVLGFPTVNIPVPDHVPDGVWYVRADPHQADWLAAISVGSRSTYYQNGVRLLEAQVLDFTGDLYGQSIQVELHILLRPQRQFRKQNQLIEQIRRDIQDARDWAQKDRSRLDLSTRPDLLPAYTANKI